jgi:hypothetical protein
MKAQKGAVKKSTEVAGMRGLRLSQVVDHHLR